MDKPLSVAAKLLLIGAGGLAIVAGPILFLFPNDTAAYFAWTIKHPLTPLFMGANYFGGIGAVWAMRSNRWSVARALLPGIFIFAVTQLLATLLNVPVFNWQHPIAWAWLLVYISSPLATLYVWWEGERGYHPGPTESAALPAAFRPLMLIAAVVSALAGLGLWLSPYVLTPSAGGAAPWWAWTLTPLTAGVVGGWYLAAAALYATLARPHGAAAVRVALFGVMCATGVELLGALMYAGSFNGPALAAGFYLINAALIFALALFVFLKASPIGPVRNRG